MRADRCGQAGPSLYAVIGVHLQNLLERRGFLDFTSAACVSWGVGHLRARIPTLPVAEIRVAHE